MQPDAGAGSDLEAVRIKALQDNAGRLGLTWELRLASVVQNLGPDAALILFDGDGNPTGIQAVSMVGPVLAGQRVYVITSPPSANHIVGMVNGPSHAMGYGIGIYYTLGSNPTASTTPIWIGGSPVVSVTKYHDDTGLAFDLDATFFASGGDAAATFAAYEPVSGAIIQIGTLGPSNNTNGVRQAMGGKGASTNFAAGDYTFRGYYWRSAGAGTANTSSDDQWMCSVQEYWP